MADLNDSQERIARKADEIKEWEEKDRQVLVEFNNIVGTEKNESYAPLLRIFKKRVKRAKKKTGEGEEEEEDEDYDEVGMRKPPRETHGGQ